MVKRAATPPPDKRIEPKFLTIYHPYPLHANLELLEDRVEIARWVACIIGDPTLLHSIYFKPSGHNHVIVEVSNEFQQWDRLLGCHKWSEFLRHPTDEQRPKESKFYWCFHNTTRELTKLGWKQVDAENAWFVGFTPNNKKVNFPYPKSTYCKVPPEDPTCLQLCRPIPTKMFGVIDDAAPELIGPGVKTGKRRLAQPPRAVPGAASWVADKAQGRDPAPQPSPQRFAPTTGAWAKPITAKPATPARPSASSSRIQSTWPAEPDNSIWANASTGATRSVQVPMTPLEQFNAEDLTAEQISERLKRIEFDWAEEMDQEDRNRGLAMQTKESKQEVAATNEWTGPAAEDKPDPFAPLASFNPLGGDDDDEDDGGFYAVNPAWGIPVLAEEDMKRTEAFKAGPKKAKSPAAPEEDRGGYSGGPGKSLFVGWTCPYHGVTCRAGICPEAAQRKKEVEREERKKQGGKRVEHGMHAFIRPTNGHAVVQVRDGTSDNARGSGGGGAWRGRNGGNGRRV